MPAGNLFGKPAAVDREALPKKMSTGGSSKRPSAINSKRAELRLPTATGSCRAALQNELYARVTGTRFDRHIEVCARDGEIQAG